MAGDRSSSSHQLVVVLQLFLGSKVNAETQVDGVEAKAQVNVRGHGVGQGHSPDLPRVPPTEPRLAHVVRPEVDGDRGLREPSNPAQVTMLHTAEGGNKMRGATTCQPSVHTQLKGHAPRHAALSTRTHGTSP